MSQDSLLESHAQVWRAFVGSETTLGPTPGVREQWHRGRPRYAVWLLPIHNQQVLDRMAAVAAAVEPWVEPVPRQEAHVTLWVCGFPATSPRFDDDLDEQILTEQPRSLTPLPKPIPLTIGPANSFHSAVYLEVVDSSGLVAEARRRLGGSYPHGHRGELRFGPYLPHVTVGSYRASYPTAEVHNALSRHRQLPPLSITSPGPQLMQLQTEARAGS